MKVAICGADGQLGRELQATAGPGAELTAWGRTALDVTDAGQVAGRIEAFGPKVVINAAAYTAVDRAESEPDRARAVNALGAANVARAAHAVGARLIHISTDFVFDGRKSSPYRPDDPAAPLGVYGASKLEGEREVARITAGRALIVRSAWIYSVHGGNFVKSMLHAMAQRAEVRVVSDQVGTPTWAKDLAYALWVMIPREALHGVHHWTNAGVASWYDLAVAVQEEALALGLLAHAPVIRPIATAEYPTPARRPSYSVLDKGATWAALGETARHWRVALRGMLGELRERGGA